MNRTRNLALLTLATIGLAACGNNVGDRALSGAGLGAAGGTAFNVLTGGSLAGGAVVGGLAGAAAGALTDRNTIDLGKPIWR